MHATAFHDDDTIAAISTAPGEGGIGIVRLSGIRALQIASQLFRGSRQFDIASVPTHSLHYGHIVHPVSEEWLDEALLAVMRAPHSYTREDVVEIQCHGGMLPLRNILDAALTCGARLATPGEFTKRAYLNGRIDLAQAESVIDIIRAKTDAGLQLAVKQLQGKLSAQVRELRDALQQLLAEIEASIDFSDDDIELISFAQIQCELRRCLDELSRLLATAREGKIVRDGLSLAIVGKPNVGKSSLLNLLLQEERAIVTPIPGTTRDAIEEYINLSGIPIRLIDTAGIRDTDDHVERIGVERTRQIIQQADMAICLFDRSTPLTAEDRKFAEFVADNDKLIVLNKADLPAQWDVADILNLFAAPVSPIELSITQHLGVDALKQAMVERVLDVPLESVAVTNARHKQALSAAQASLRHAEQSAQAEMSPEFLAVDLRDALRHLGDITGETTTDDILDRIFSTFCIGK
ncbi:tRNA modification GTPase TrmE [Candidatus Moduliflexus flocculans]|uniref:tRNA modification GTPase MnmE n=1 Tax=Candidatus Moduliflexus flocculans TaxID=1499966 RepID=A0A0S6VPF2_9BACT|nr:tRNA modification GTPase TrmE [Candidatus Moduliflexus flocculans]